MVKNGYGKLAVERVSRMKANLVKGSMAIFMVIVAFVNSYNAVVNSTGIGGSLNQTLILIIKP
jgi:hypothetical protein